MKTEPRGSRRRILVGCTLAAVVVLGLARDRLMLRVYQQRREFTRISLDPSPYLRDVAEPITITKGTFHGGSDDHWMGLTFEDSRKVSREASYVIYFPDVQNALLLGDKRVTGREECVFLGLLQRWARQHPEVAGLRDRARKRDPDTGDSPLDRGEFTEQEVGKLVADAMIRILLKRN